MPEQLTAAAALIGDIGGTNTRLALSAGGRYFEVAHFANAGAAGLDVLIERYLHEHQPVAAELQLWLAVAAPVRGDAVAMTNLPWRISAPELEARFGFRRVRLVNDFAAVALSLGALEAADWVSLGGGPGAADAPRLVLGPGTGLGAALWIPAAGRDFVLATEAGHVTLAAGDEREAAVIAAARRRNGHVSAERLLSGPGLSELYRLLAEVEGRAVDPPPPAAVTARGDQGSDPLAVAALELFFSLLGGFAGNLALSTGARGGVFLAGGILPRLREALAASAFRTRFLAKGRFAAYLDEIPLALIVHPDPGLLGLAHASGLHTTSPAQ